MKFVKKTVAVLALSALLAGCTVVPPAADPTVPPKPSAGPTQPQAPAQPTDPSQSPAADQNMSLLSAARMGEIADAWYLTTSAPLGAWCTDEDEGFTDGVRYYGSYGGYDILFRPNGDDAITTLEVEDVTFEHRTGFEIYAYQDGSFTPIKELASQGKLTGGHPGADEGRLPESQQADGKVHHRRSFRGLLRPVRRCPCGLYQL